MDLGKMLFSAEGRIRRRDYWLWSIVVATPFVIVHILCVWVSVGFLPLDKVRADSPHLAVIVLWLGTALPTGWALLCLEIKRWHDRDKSWEWTFIKCIPVVGNIWALVECGFLDSTPGENEYGSSPKARS